MLDESYYLAGSTSKLTPSALSIISYSQDCKMSKVSTLRKEIVVILAN